MSCKKENIKKGFVLAALLLCITVMLKQIVICRGNCQVMKQSSRYQVVSLEEESVSAKQLQTTIAHTQESNLVGGYYYDASAEFFPKGIKRKISTPLVALTFSNTNFIPATASLNVDDKQGCLLDKNTMYDLFGTEHCENQILLYNNEEYHVRGLLLTKEPLVVIQNKDDTAWLGSIVINVKNELYRNQFKEAELGSYPLKNDDYYVADYNRFMNWIETPNQWSDFAFFKTFFQQVQEKWEHILYENKDAVECSFERGMIRRGGYEVEVVLLGVISFALCLILKN